MASYHKRNKEPRSKAARSLLKTMESDWGKPEKKAPVTIDAFELHRQQKDFIEAFLRKQFPKFKPDCWGRTVVDGRLDTFAGYRILVCGYDNDERRQFDVVLVPREDLIDIVKIFERKVIHESPLYRNM